MITFIQKIAQTKYAFSIAASLVWMHLISVLDTTELHRRANHVCKTEVGEPLGQLQLNLT